jgi:hypothetical protein
MFSITGVPEAGMLVNLRRVELVEGAGNILTFRLEQKDTGMMLMAKNSFDATIKYRASMSVSGDFYHTSSCPVRPGLSTFELWPHTIAQLRITDFVLLDMSDTRAMRCE